MLESVHDGNHDGAVRTFVGLSCEPGGIFNYNILHGTIFFATRSVILRGATVPMVVGPTLTLWTRAQTLFASTALFKVCLINSVWWLIPNNAQQLSGYTVAYYQECKNLNSVNAGICQCVL